MAQALFSRLNAVFSDAPERRVVAERVHWPGGTFASDIADVRAMVVHETSGWPTRNHGQNMFFREFFGGDAHARHTGETTQLYVAGDGTVLLGMTLPGRTWHANFVNDWSLGSETGHGWGNYGGNEHIGPHTSTNETPGPAFGAAAPLRAKPGNRWQALSGDDDPAVDDFVGVKAWIRDRGLAEVLVGLWTTAGYAGPWRQAQRVPEMLFSEAQYRGWALLARYLAERFLIPRNFPLLAHKQRSSGFGVAGGQHAMVQDAASFRRIVRADEALSRSPATFGLAAPQFADDAQLEQAYRNAVEHVPALVVPNNPAASHREFDRNRLWRLVFNRYRGFHGHGFSGDPDRGKDHDCPGPMFDWHRFAREVWDWWWHPFDFDAARATTSVPRRPYSRDWDGDTPLSEHFFNIPRATYEARAVPGIHGNTGSPRTYRLEQGSPVYALANGELVAARFPPETGQVSLAFALVRHEVFHELDLTVLLPDVVRAQLGLDPLPARLPDRLSYDVQPSTVYSLYMHLGRPQGMTFDAVDAGNPDWLNRLIMRRRECELGVAFHRANPPAPANAAAWNGRPPGAVSPRALRPTVLEGWTEDDAQLRPTFERLRRGELTLVPGTLWSTPIRVLLGDFMGNAGVISRSHLATTHGVRIEVFSPDVLSAADFAVTESDAARRWTPQPGAPARPGGPAVRYPSEWSRVPVGAEQTSLQGAGVDVELVPWWSAVQEATRVYQLYPDEARLPGGGWAVHYDPDAFMQWLNTRTWRSEWPKYRADDPAGVPAQPRPRGA